MSSTSNSHPKVPTPSGSTAGRSSTSSSDDSTFFDANETTLDDTALSSEAERELLSRWDSLFRSSATGSEEIEPSCLALVLYGDQLSSARTDLRPMSSVSIPDSLSRGDFTVHPVLRPYHNSSLDKSTTSLHLTLATGSENTETALVPYYTGHTPHFTPCSSNPGSSIVSNDASQSDPHTVSEFESEVPLRTEVSKVSSIADRSSGTFLDSVFPILGVDLTYNLFSLALAVTSRLDFHTEGGAHQVSQTEQGSKVVELITSVNSGEVASQTSTSRIGDIVMAGGFVSSDEETTRGDGDLDSSAENSTRDIRDLAISGAYISSDEEITKGFESNKETMESLINLIDSAISLWERRAGGAKSSQSHLSSFTGMENEVLPLCSSKASTSVTILPSNNFVPSQNNDGLRFIPHFAKLAEDSPYTSCRAEAEYEGRY